MRADYLNTPMVSTCNRSEVERMCKLRARGHTFQQIGESMGRCASSVNRYVRLYEKYGRQAFAVDATRALKTGDVRRIRDLYERGMSKQSIAATTAFNIATVTKVVEGMA